MPMSGALWLCRRSVKQALPSSSARRQTAHSAANNWNSSCKTGRFAAPHGECTAAGCGAAAVSGRGLHGKGCCFGGSGAHESGRTAGVSGDAPHPAETSLPGTAKAAGCTGTERGVSNDVTGEYFPQCGVEKNEKIRSAT